jgi:hypothetical protein
VVGKGGRVKGGGERGRAKGRKRERVMGKGRRVKGGGKRGKGLRWEKGEGLRM